MQDEASRLGTNAGVIVKWLELKCLYSLYQLHDYLYLKGVKLSIRYLPNTKQQTIKISWWT